MALYYDTALDDGLDDLGLVTALHICSAEPTTYTEATSTYSLGSKSSPTINAAENGDTDGRKRVVAAITDGSVSTTGTATHVALVSGAALIAVVSLTSSQAVTSGNTFTTDAFDITLRDATAV